jgi:hypothetical protein
MKINEINYEGDCECDSEPCVDVFIDIGISIFERNIKIICEHNTSMYYELENENNVSINKNKQGFLDNDFFYTDLSNDIFEDIGMYLMERNMTINLENNYKQTMNNVLNELKNLYTKCEINDFENNSKQNILNKINSFGSISNFYISGEDPDLSSDDYNSTKYSDTDEILFPGLNEM